MGENPYTRRPFDKPDSTPSKMLPITRFFPSPNNTAAEIETFASSTSYAAYFNNNHRSGIPNYADLIGGSTLFFDQDAVVDLLSRNGEYPDATTVEIGYLIGNVSIPTVHIDLLNRHPRGAKGILGVPYKTHKS